MQKLPLFTNKKEVMQTLLVVVVLFSVSLSYQFYKYKQMTTYSLHLTTAKVIDDYQKVGKKYRILKLKNSDFTFFTSYKKPLHVKKNDIVRVVLYTNNIDFVGYLKGFYASLKALHVEKVAVQNRVVKFVEKQHTSPMMRELYSALFFATSISKELRSDITKWGIAHLVAISGFHLGILSAILFFLFKPVYTFFQDRFFPYRNSSADLALIVFLVLGSYAIFIGMTPSVLRAYAMSLVGFFLFANNIKIISFGTLFFTICTILILFPSLIFSIAFWFSVSGVFYIFLFLHYFSNLNKISIFLLLNFWVFILMLPIVHFTFPLFSLYQLFSPLISMIFILFYPLSLLLHVSGFGGVLDAYLIWFLSLHVEVYTLSTPPLFFASYIFFSLLAIRFRVVALLLPLFALSLGLVLI